VLYNIKQNSKKIKIRKKSCQKVVKNCQKVGKKMSKKCQKVVKFVKKLSNLVKTKKQSAQKLFFATMRKKSANVTFCHNNAQKEQPKR
jgi:heme-binding NEAT domain protein